MIRDKNVEWLQKRIFIPATQMGLSEIVDATDASEDTALRTRISATSKMVEIGTTDLIGIAVGATNDGGTAVWMAPYDLDRGKQIRMRVWWTTASTDADTPTYAVVYSALAEDGGLVVPATALDTAIAADTANGTANQLQATPEGIINKNTLAATAYGLNLKVTCSALGGAAAGELKILGLEIRYTPRRCAGPERNLRGGRRLTASKPLGVELASTQEG